MIYALILASGYSSRMGKPKSTLLWSDSENFAEKILREYLDFGCEKVTIVLNSENYEIFHKQNRYRTHPRVNSVLNRSPEKERFYSIKLGISSFIEDNPEVFFLQNIDNPFVSRQLLDCIAKNTIKDGYGVPVYQNRGGHPILLNNEILHKMNRAKHDIILKEFLKQFKRKNILWEDDSIFRNINTMEIYEAYKDMMGR